MGGSDIDSEQSMQLVIVLVQCIFALIIAALLFIWTLGLALNLWLHKRKLASEEDNGLPSEKLSPEEEAQKTGISCS